MNIEDILERIDVPSTDVAADVRRGERALTRRRQSWVGGTACVVALVTASVVGLGQLDRSGSEGPANQTPTSVPTPAAVRGVLDKNARIILDTLDPERELLFPAVVINDDSEVARTRFDYGGVGKRAKAWVEVAVTTSWHRAPIACQEVGPHCSAVSLPGGGTGFLASGPRVPNGGSIYAFRRPNNGYVIEISFFDARRDGQPVDVDIAEERIARLLANRELAIPGNPASKPPPWSSSKSAQILSDLLRDEDGALTDVKLRDPRYAKVHAMWSGDSVPSAYVQLSLFRTDRDPGPPSCRGECENLVIDGKDVVVGQPKGTRGDGYFVLYLGSLHSVYIEYVNKPGVEDFALSPERLGQIATDDSWQEV